MAEKNGDKKTEAACYVKLGKVFNFLGENVKAQEYQEKALAIAEKNGNRETEADCYINLACICHSTSEYDKAKEYQEKALAIAKTFGDNETEAKCFVIQGNIFQSLGEYVKAKTFQEKALSIAAKTGDSQTVVNCYVNLGCIYPFLREYDSAKEYQEKALAIARKIGDRETEAKCYVNRGRVFEGLCEYNKAKEHQEKALAIAEQIGDRETEAKCCLNLGCIFWFLAEYDKAKKYLNKAIAIGEKIGDRETEGECYENLGVVFQSLGEYDQAKTYQEKALAIAEKIGTTKTEATCYLNLGSISQSLCEYAKAKEYLRKARSITERSGDWETEAKCYVILGRVFHSLGEYVKAKEYSEKALAIAQEIGNRKTEVACHANLGKVFESLNEYTKGKEYLERALAFANKIGDRKTEATCYGDLGVIFQTRGEFGKAKEYLEKAIEISEKIGDRKTEAKLYELLARQFYRDDVVKTKEYLERALAIYKDIGEIEQELLTHLIISYCTIIDNTHEAKSHFFASINNREVIRRFLKEHDQFKISYFDKTSSYYRLMSQLLCLTGNPYEGLYTEEIGRGRALADLMSAQYSTQNERSVCPQAWDGIQRIMKKENNCVCLYISYYEDCINLFVVKADNQLILRHKNVNDCFAGKRSASRVADVFSSEIYRKVQCLAPEQCEDRSWFPSNDLLHQKRKSSQENSLTVSRLVEEDADDQQHILTLADGYKMIIAPVAELLDKPEIIIVPDRLLFTVPFAALKDEKGKYLSESFRIRIIPSLTTLKMIQDSPADYHSHTGALIVGDPDVGEVLYKGNLQQISRLPFAGDEVEMIEKHLGIQPLLGKQATKQAVLKNINSVSLIHLACHGNAERGEIVLAPPPFTDRKPQEEDYLLTMADISQVRLRAKLVVLSCCHSAKGQIKTEGVVGIARAFLGSGARSVLVALWAIYDEATMQFMSRFYEHLVRGESASESLHQAMKWMRENGFSDVGQWAPFMLIGDNVTLDFQTLRLVDIY